MRRKLLGGVSVLAAGSVMAMVAPAVAFADGSSLTPAEQAFQASLTTYIQNLQSAVTAESQNPATQAAIAPKLSDMMSSLSTAESQIPQLTGAQLDAMQGLLGQTDTSWQQQPLVMQQNLSGVTVKGPGASDPAGYLSDCSTSDESPSNARGFFYASWAAQQVSSAAQAVASGMPDGVTYAPALIIASAVYAVAGEAAIVLQNELALSVDCATAQANAAQEAIWPTSPESSSTAYTPMSSQYSVDQLITLVGGIQTTLDLIQTTINTVTANLQTTINNVGTAQGTVNSIIVTATDLQSRTDSLLTSVGTPSDTATDNCQSYAGGTPCTEPTNTSNGLANTLGSREDTTLSKTSTFQNLSLRAEIEASLAQPSNGIVALFALPYTQGGYLNAAPGSSAPNVQSIVTQTINSMVTAKQSVGSAQAKLSSANAALAANQYDTAYGYYQQAYQLASS